MRLLRVGMIDLNQPSVGCANYLKRAVRRCAARTLWRRWVNRPCLLFLLVFTLFFTLDQALADKAKGRHKKQATASAAGSPAENSLANIPLPIGHEAKGLVLPDFDSEGHLRGKFEAGTARRIDEEHVQFNALKITTYTPEARPDLTIVMNQSIFDLKTRILSSNEHTTVTRSDFNIIGDAVEFDTNTRTGKLTGNVKMVITDESKFKPQNAE